MLFRYVLLSFHLVVLSVAQRGVLKYLSLQDYVFVILILTIFALCKLKLCCQLHTCLLLDFYYKLHLEEQITPQFSSLSITGVFPVCECLWSPRNLQSLPTDLEVLLSGFLLSRISTSISKTCGYSECCSVFHHCLAGGFQLWASSLQAQ